MDLQENPNVGERRPLTSYRRVRRALGASALVLTGLLLSAGPATASHVACGDTLASNTTLDSNVGPCAGDGLRVNTDGITLNPVSYTHLTLPTTPYV